MLAKNYDEMEKIVKGDVRLMEVVNELKILGRDNDFLKVYDPDADRDFMIAEVEAAGEKRGEAIGIEKNQEKTVRNMIKKGFDFKTISEVTGLSTGKIKSFML